MNKVELVGNLTRDPELRQTNNGTSVARFTVAVTRRYKSADGQQQTDFISCVAWRQQAEFVARYFSKGSKIGVIGSIRTSSYDDQHGQRRYVTEVECDELEFVTPKSDNPNRGNSNYGSGSYNNDSYGGGGNSYSAPPQEPPRTQQPSSAAQMEPTPVLGGSDSVFQDDTGGTANFEPLEDAELPF